MGLLCYRTMDHTVSSLMDTKLPFHLGRYPPLVHNGFVRETFFVISPIRTAGLSIACVN